MRKAQTEIIGLMVIVILFIFVGAMYVVFTSGEKAEPMRDVERQITVANLLDSFLQLTPCDEKMPMDQMSDIIKDCYTSGTGVCNFECKEYIETAIKEMMNAYRPKQMYAFEIKDSSKTWLMLGSCATANKITPARDFVSGTSLKLEVVLTFCS